MPDTPSEHGSLWIDGSLVDAAEATVSPFDHGITVGDGMFETLQVVRGMPFAARRHLARLRRSAAGLRLPVPLDDDELRAAMQAVIEANGVDAGRLRLTVTGGVGPLGSDRGPAGATVIVATAGLPALVARDRAWPPWRWRRNEHSAVAGLKTTTYAENVVALDDAHRARQHRGDLRQHGRPALRGHRQQRVRRARRSAAAHRRCRRAAWPASPVSCCSSWSRWTRSICPSTRSPAPTRRS